MSLGTRHSSLIDCENNFYVFGWNKYGQLESDINNKNNFEIDDQDFNIEEPMKCVLFNKKSVDVKSKCWFSIFMISFN